MRATPPPPTSAASREAQKARRLAEALRANLARRKAQKRARDAAGAEGADADGPAAGRGGAHDGVEPGREG